MNDVLQDVTLSGPATATDVRQRLLDTLRRDLIGPGPHDGDIRRETLKENPSRWYLSGFLAPSPGGGVAGAAAPERETLPEEGDPLFGDDLGADPEIGQARAADDAPPDEPSARPRRLPASLGLTVLLDAAVSEVEVEVLWGDYVTEPPLPLAMLEDESVPLDAAARKVQWRRVPGRQTVRLPVADGRGEQVIVPESAGQQKPAGGLTLEAHARSYPGQQADGSVRPIRVLTVMLVNRRLDARRRFADVAFAFQARLQLSCAAGLYPRSDFSGFGASDPDQAIADLHYRDLQEFAVGRGVSAGWEPDADGVVRRAWTDHLPQAEVERVEPNEGISGVTFGMEDLASRAAEGGAELLAALQRLPTAYRDWIEGERKKITGIEGAPRQATAQQLIAAAEQAAGRIEAGIALVGADDDSRLAFRAMNEAVARAARRRNAGPGGDPVAQRPPTWRPFQLAFVLLNLPGLADRTHPDRKLADLLFFPTGGGKTEAYLGLAAWTIAHRRLTNGGLLGAGVAILMRYTLRLLTLDQLSRAAGVICALELMRGEAGWQRDGKKLLGEWPIEIGLWVGSAASPNRLGKTGDKRDDTAVARIRHYKRDGREAPAPIKACPWCQTPFDRNSFACDPSDQAPRNMVIRCSNAGCDFTRDKPLPVLTVDEAIYRRLPAFLIATVDKFAGLPWIAHAGAFFGHVDRHDEWGFYGAADLPRDGKPLWHRQSLLPPDLVIQDELHLISGPLGTVAALYEVALDRLAMRRWEGVEVRPKVVASTATVRRARDQVAALFMRDTAIFPPPGPARSDSFFAVTVPSSRKPARLYVGLASPGRGPKLIFLRVLTTLLAAARAAAAAGDPADAYETALCYFNALRELGGARRIVEDEVRSRLATYGGERRRVAPMDQPFADRSLREVLELTSRVSTDQVAAAKERLGKACADPKEGVDVALATNMISVGLDIQRLGLMLVQGQPKTAAEYIQATSRVGRDERRPGLVLVLLNAHKPRDRLHHESFRHFHACFYRAVEATSVTPWAARALDRALVAVVVGACRHLAPALSHEDAVAGIVGDAALQAEVTRTILERAPPEDVVGGHAALRAAIDGVFRDWEATAKLQTENGDKMYYGKERAKALLHDPLDTILDSLPPAHRRFTAARSMRDVEHVSPLKVVDPWGNALNDR